MVRANAYFAEAVDPTTVTAASLSLASGAGPVSGRVAMGSGNRSASFLPSGSLEPVTAYTISATEGILDTSGNPLLPFTSSFTTLDDSIPELNPDALTVSFPDASGVVRVEAPAFSFEANAFVTIVNLTNGTVVSGNVGSDGSVLFELRASIADELQIRVVDSSNREIVIEKTEFRGPNGEVAIGRKGGKIRSGDFELEVPSGALTGASVFTLTPVDPAVVAALAVPGGAGGLGSAVEVSTGGAVLREEADLSFPIPPEAPSDAEHVIVRKVLEEGLEVYEIIDTGAVVDGRVRTESPPFLGFLVSGFYLDLWYPKTPAQKNPMGAITGIARETDASAVEPREVPLSGVQVRVDESLHRGSYVATTDEEGRFVLLDQFFGGLSPTLNLVARDTSMPPREVRAVAFQSQEILSRFLTLTRFSGAGEVVFNFPLSPPPPPPTVVTISLFRKDGESRIPVTNGFAAVGDELIVRVEFTQPPEFVSVVVNGENVAVSRLPDERVDEQTVFSFEGTFTPEEARSYTIVAEARDAFLNLLTARKSFLAAQGGAGNEERLAGPPSVISDSEVPRNGDTGVPVTQVMSAQFTEPVTNVSSATITLEELGEAPAFIPLTIIATKVGGAVGPVSPTDEVVAVTLTPQRGLKFGTKYRLTFSTAIVDTDLSPTGQPDPKPLNSDTSTIEFETFRPTKLGEAPLQGSLVSMATLDHLAFVALQPPNADGSTGTLQVFDLSDPTQPVKQGDDSVFIGSMVRDIDVEREVPLDDGVFDLAAVLSVNPRSGNSGLTLFDVTSRSSPFPYGGFVTTVIPGGGADYQVDLHEGFAYVATFQEGLKIVSLREAKKLYQAKRQSQAPPEPGEIPFDVSRGLFTKGVGFGQPAIQNQVQIPDPAGSGSLRVTSVQIGGTDQDRVGYLGSLSLDGIARFSTLGLASTPVATTHATVRLKTPPDPEGNSVHMGFPSDIALTDIGADKFALVAGGPMAANGRGTLAILRVTDPGAPELVTVVELQGGWGTSLAVDEDGVTVFVSVGDRREGGTTIPGGVEIYNLIDAAQPEFAGKMEGFGAGSGGLGLARGILTTAASTVGVQTATVGPAMPMIAVEKPVVLVNADHQTEEDIPISYRILPSVRGVAAATVEIADELGNVLFSTPVPIVERGETVWPKGQAVVPTPTEIEFRVRNPDGQESNTTTGAFVANFPSITSVVPSRIVVGSPETVLEVTGENFGPSPGVEIDLPTGEALTLEAEEIGPDGFTVTLSSADLTTLGSASLYVIRGGLRSNEFPVSVVSAIGPKTPVLDAIEPDQVVAGANSTWITLRGSGFEDGVSFVRLDGATDTLIFERLSSEEIRALVPASYLQESGRLTLQVGSLVDSFFVSEPRVLDVLPSVGAILAPLPPEIARSGVPEVPYPPPEGPASQTVSIRGSGFQSGATVTASIDGAVPVELPTTVLSSAEIEVELSRALWSKHSTTFRLALQTTTGLRTVQTSLQNSSGPTIIVFDQNGKETGTLEPSLFHDKRLFQPGATPNARPRDFGYLVWDTTGQRRGNRTFRDNPRGFYIEVRDPTAPDINNVAVELSTGDSSGATIDRIPQLKLDAVGNGVFRMKNDHRIVVVTDEVDDTDNLLNDKGDGDPEDRTIRGVPGRGLSIRYLVNGALKLQKNVGICSSRRKIRLHLVNMYPATDPVAPDIRDNSGNLIGTGTGQPSDAQILRLVNQAGEIWAAMCVDFEIVSHNGSSVIRAPAPNNGLMTQPDVERYVFPNAPAVRRVALSQDLRDVIDQNLPLGGNVRPFDVRVFFIEGFTKPGVQVAEPTRGESTAAFAYVDQLRQGTPPQVIPFNLLPPINPNLMGVAFVGWRVNDPAARLTFKTIAHEIAHLVFNQDESPPDVHILVGHRPQPLLEKRFTEELAEAKSQFLKNP